MSTTSSTSSAASKASASTSKAAEKAPGTEIESSEDDHGRTTIAESVVAKIAALATTEVNGVDSLGGAISGAIAGVVGRVRGAEHKTAGVGVEVGTRQAAVDLTMKVRYPYPIHEVADSVRQNVIDRIESMTGLEVVEVNIAITDLAFDSDAPDPGDATVGAPSDRVS